MGYKIEAKRRRGDILTKEYYVYKQGRLVIRHELTKEEAIKEADKQRLLITAVDKIWDELGLKGRG